ncbi:MAG: hypothetical protein IH800_06495 [Myxococcales bacterium]|nr:hypothetical protein [Myxococcales bacterium]TDI96811.1 MAG: hypothetical protein E2O73_12375 [Deltaproteobacteria bacterium]
MADRVRKINYCYLTVSNRPGHAAKVMDELRKADINLLAFSAFPAKAGKSQLDLVADKMAGVRSVAKKNGWRLSKVKKGFLVQGSDKVGAVSRHIQKLGDRKINVTAADAVAAGSGRYGMILWVKPKDYARATRALGAR